MSRRSVGPSLLAPSLVALPRTALRAFRSVGVDIDAIARRSGIATADARMPPNLAHRIVAGALDLVDDPGFALRAGAAVRPELFGVVGFSIMAAPTFRDAFHRLTRYVRVLGGGAFQLTTQPNGDVVARRATFAGTDPRVDRAHLEFELSSIVAIGKLLTGSPLVPARVALRGPIPSHAAAYAGAFGVAPELEARHDELAIHCADLDRPVVSSSREHDAVFTALADDLLIECSAAPVGRHRVRAALTRLIAVGRPSLDEVAQSLGTSKRTLQRQLAAEETSYADVLDEVCHEVACAQLVSPNRDVPLAELATMLGFSGAAALRRAFRRWEGTTPRDYRARQLLTAGGGAGSGRAGSPSPDRPG